MKRFCLGLVFLTALISSPATGFAEVEGVYLAISSGATFRDNADLAIDGVNAGTSSFNTGSNFGTAVGVQLNHHFRIETEISFRDNNVDRVPGFDANVLSSAFLLNGFYDFDPVGPVRPFVGAGVGLGVVHVDSILGFDLDEDTTALAYQGTAGIQWEFRPQWTLSLAYRYLATTDVEFITPIGKLATEFNSHELAIGLRFLFKL